MFSSAPFHFDSSSWPLSSCMADYCEGQSMEIGTWPWPLRNLKRDLPIGQFQTSTAVASVRSPCWHTVFHAALWQQELGVKLAHCKFQLHEMLPKVRNGELGMFLESAKGGGLFVALIVNMNDIACDLSHRRLRLTFCRMPLGSVTRGAVSIGDEDEGSGISSSFPKVAPTRSRLGSNSIS